MHVHDNSKLCHEYFYISDKAWNVFCSEQPELDMFATVNVTPCDPAGEADRTSRRRVFLGIHRLDTSDAGP